MIEDGYFLNKRLFFWLITAFSWSICRGKIAIYARVVDTVLKIVRRSKRVALLDQRFVWNAEILLMICSRAGIIIQMTILRYFYILYRFFPISIRFGDMFRFLFSLFPVLFKQVIQCYMCKSFGHLCCAKYVNSISGEVSCYKCGQQGHTGLVSILSIIFF